MGCFGFLIGDEDLGDVAGGEEPCEKDGVGRIVFLARVGRRALELGRGAYHALDAQSMQGSRKVEPRNARFVDRFRTLELRDPCRNVTGRILKSSGFYRTREGIKGSGRNGSRMDIKTD